MQKKDLITKGNFNAVTNVPPVTETVYIGTKIIRAKPMTSDEFAKLKGKSTEGAEDVSGYLVIYEDNYTSWSPKSTFERAYRAITHSEFDLIK